MSPVRAWQATTSSHWLTKALNASTEALSWRPSWTRELWIQSLGLEAVLPPPEEEKQVETAIGAARAEQAREQMMKH